MDIFWVLNIEGSAEYETYADNLLLMIKIIILVIRIHLYYYKDLFTHKDIHTYINGEV